MANRRAPFEFHPYPNSPYITPMRRRLKLSDLLPLVGLIALFSWLKWSGAL